MNENQTETKLNAQRIVQINRIATAISNALTADDVNPRKEPNTLEQRRTFLTAVFRVTIDDVQRSIEVQWTQNTTEPDPEQFRTNISVRLALVLSQDKKIWSVVRNPNGTFRTTRKAKKKT